MYTFTLTVFSVTQLERRGQGDAEGAKQPHLGPGCGCNVPVIAAREVKPLWFRQFFHLRRSPFGRFHRTPKRIAVTVPDRYPMLWTQEFQGNNHTASPTKSRSRNTNRKRRRTR
jgi:hypothetical protein